MVLKTEITTKMTPQKGLELPLVDPSCGKLQVQIQVQGTPKGLQTLTLSISNSLGARKLAKEARRSQKSVKLNSGHLTKKSKTAINPFKLKRPRWIRQQFELTTNLQEKAIKSQNQVRAKTVLDPSVKFMIFSLSEHLFQTNGRTNQL